MEIERAVRGSSDARLRAKYDAAVYIIRRAYALYPYVRHAPRARSLLFCIHSTSYFTTAPSHTASRPGS